MKNKEWFRTWFDTKYYHLLYRNRNEGEAHRFIDALLHLLKPAPESTFIDVACGKGRHSIYLNSRGYRVCGLDLSQNSIAEASKASSDSLNFYHHDIRNAFPIQDCDYAMNLFTSFGYFESAEEHVKMLKNIRTALKPSGTFVLDYLNVDQVVKDFCPEAEETIDDVHFSISKQVEGNKIIKTIKVRDGEFTGEFKEHVMAFSNDDLSNMMLESGFKIQQTLGDYELNSFASESPRVIIIAQRR